MSRTADIVHPKLLVGDAAVGQFVHRSRGHGSHVAADRDGIWMRRRQRVQFIVYDDGGLEGVHFGE